MLKPSFDDPVGFNNTLRWIALLSGRLNLNLAASGNIRTDTDMIKQILAGADVVQIASVLYKEGLEKIKEMTTGLKKWMKEKKFSNIADFHGKLNQKNDPQQNVYIRAQYMKIFGTIE